MRIVSWNIKHAELRGLGAIADALRPLDADLIALQEVDRGVARSHREDQPRLLGESLSLAHGFSPALQLEGGDYGCALLVKPGLIGGRPLCVRSIALPGGAAPGEESRALLCARAGGLRIFVTHLDLPDELRVRQAEAIVAAIGSPRSTILIGDFNEGTARPAVRRILSHGMRDAWHDCIAQERTTAPADRPQERIDLVLLGADVPKASAARIVETDASDHPIVVVEL